MMSLLLFVVVVGGVGLAAGAWLVADARPRAMRSVGLRFGSDVTADQVRAALGLLTGVSRLSSRAVVVFDTLATSDGISFRLHAPQAVMDGLRGQLAGVVPSLRMDPLGRVPSLDFAEVTRLRLSPRTGVLRVDAQAEATASLLGAFGPLAEGEAVLLRWQVAPGRPLRLASAKRGGRERRHPLVAWWLAPGELGPEHLKALGRKQAEPTLCVEGLVAVQARHPKRAGHLAGRIVSVLGARSTPHGRLRSRRLPAHARRRMVQLDRRPRQAWISPSELSSLVAWPIAAPQVPGLELGAAPLLMPSPRLPQSGPGRVFATATWPGMTERTLLQPPDGALQHTLLLGPTGVGKSALVTNLAAQSVAQGRAVVMLDMKGDTATDLLARIPADRVDDVIVLEPALGLPVPGLKVFGDGDPEVVADMLLGNFRGLFKDSWGVRSDQYLRQAFVTLANDRDATLADLTYLFSNTGYRRNLVGRIDDPWLQAAWASFEAMSPSEQAQHLASPLRKINEVVGRRVVRAVLAQSRPKFDLHDVMRTGKVVVISLPPGRLGEPAAQLLGALVVYQLYTAVLARQAIPEVERTAVDFYLDEPKALGAGMPIPLDAAFELFRGLGCGITLAGQAITQLPKAVQQAAMTNAGTLVAFRQNRPDATLLAHDLPGVGVEALQHLGKHEIAMKLSLGPGDVLPVVTGRTLPLPNRLSDPDEVRRRSATRYGVDPAEVDEQLRARHNAPASPAAAEQPDMATNAAPVGKRSRRAA